MQQVRKNSIVILLFFLASLSTFAQNVVLNGIVQDAQTQEPLPGVIVLADTVPTALTDANGNYRCFLASGSHTLSFRIIGYQRFEKTITIASKDSLSLVTLLTPVITPLNTIVVAAGRYEQKVSDLTVSMEVIKADLVTNKNTTTLENIVNQVPGVNVVDGQASIRSGSGFSYGAGSRVLLLVDELPMLTADAGSVKWTFLPTENLEQIEVIKGAASVLYGSSALNGIINIRTAYPKDKPQTKITTHFMGYDTPKRPELKWWKHELPFFSGTEFTHLQKFNRFDLVLGGNLFNHQGYRQSEQVQRIRFNFNTRYRFKKCEGLSAGINGNIIRENAHLFILWKNADTGAYTPAAGTVSFLDHSSFSIDPFIKYSSSQGDRHSLRARIYNSKNAGSVDQASDATLYYTEYQYQRTFGKTLSVITGVVNTLSDIKSAKFYGDHTGRNTATYLQVEKKINRLTLSAGARAEYFRVDTLKTTEKILGVNAKPVFRAGMNYHLAKQTYLRGSYGQGYRFPAIAERFVTTNVGGLKVFPNVDLQPETGWSAELGIKQGIAIKDWNGYADIAVFNTEYNQMIEFVFGYYLPPSLTKPSLSQLLSYAGFKSVNVGNTRISGVDVTLTGTGKLLGMNMTVMAGYTYTNPMNRNYDIALDTTSSSPTNVLKYRYYHSFKGDLQFDYKKWSLGASLRYTGFVINIDKKFEEPIFAEVLPTFPIYILPGLKEYRQKNNTGGLFTDFRLSYQWNPHFKWSLIVNNAFNEEYMDRPANILPQRQLGLQMQLLF